MEAGELWRSIMVVLLSVTRSVSDVVVILGLGGEGSMALSVGAHDERRVL
jgi:hypothetical protein